jgi:hypothetical protein
MAHGVIIVLTVAILPALCLGRNLTFKARKLLEWLNVPTEEIERINLESLKHKSIEGLLGERQEVIQKLQSIEFEDRDLPSDTQT